MLSNFHLEGIKCLVTLNGLRHWKQFSGNGIAEIKVCELKPKKEYSFVAKTMGAMALWYAVNGTVGTDSTPTDVHVGKKNA